MKKIVVLVFVFAALTICSAVATDWTFMVYLDGDNNLEGAGIDDINEMEMVGSNDDIKIVVLFDRIPGYDSSNGDWTDTRRGLIIRDSNPYLISSPLDSVGEKNMGAPATLSEFVNWAIATYPANHYALVLWNHGGGWRDSAAALAKKIAYWEDAARTSSAPAQRSQALLRLEKLREEQKKTPVLKEVCVDNTSGDVLYTREVRQALEGVPTKLDIVGFDACLMQMMEVAYEVRNEADYMVGSEHTEPSDGWPYHLILADLRSNPGMTPAQFASVIVSRYGESYGGAGTQSAVDLSKMSGLASSLSSFASAMISADTEWQNYFHSRINSVYYSDISFRDLGTFLAQMISRAQSPAVLAAAEQSQSDFLSAVVANHSGSREGASGLSIYLTNLSSYPSGNYNSSQILFAADTQWDEMLLAAGAKSIPDDDHEPNDDFEHASQLQVGSSTVGLCCVNDDWFKVSLSLGAKVCIAMYHEFDAGDLELELRDASNTLLATSATGYDLESIYYEVPANGIYYIRVYGYMGAKNYFYDLHIYDSNVSQKFQLYKPSYKFEDYSAAARLIMGDDDFTAVSINFDFSFYGTKHSTIMICANGYLTFGNSGNIYANQAIPIPIGPGTLIAPFWDDLVPPDTGGGVFYETRGEAGHRKLIVTWADCSHWVFANHTAGITFQAVLSESDNSIRFNYQDVNFSDSRYNFGESATVGLQDETGTLGYVYSYNRASLADQTSLLFMPIGDGGKTPAGTAWVVYE